MDFYDSERSIVPKGFRIGGVKSTTEGSATFDASVVAASVVAASVAMTAGDGLGDFELAGGVTLGGSAMPSIEGTGPELW